MPANSPITSFDQVADRLGLGRLSDGGRACDHEGLRRLYRYARGADGPPTFFSNDPTFVRGWLDLSASRARELLEPFMYVDEEDNRKTARNTLRTTLEAVAWNDVLRICDPPIRCRVKIHGAKWGMRFESGKNVKRGDEVLNEQLPPIPDDFSNDGDDGAEPPGEDPQPPAVPTAVRRAPIPEQDTDSEVETVLQKAGMPT